MYASPLILGIVYLGLAGTLLALVIATAQQKWSCKVFFLLALRLAIGWQFLFEGLHKVHSTYTGPTDTNRPFTSEPYFKLAPGPLGKYMRNQFGDPNEVIAAKVKAPKEIDKAAFAKLKPEEQAAECPAAVAAELEGVEGRLEKAKVEVEKTEAKAAADAKTEGEKEKAKSDAEKAKADIQKALDAYRKDGKDLVPAMKAAYARWVFGLEGRDAKVKGITGDVSLTAPQRLEHIDWLRREVKAAEERQAAGLGNGYGMDAKRVSEWRTDLITAESDLAKDANTFVADLTKSMTGGFAIPEPVEQSPGQRIDKMTMWFLVIVGSFLMAGLFTRLSCLLATGFLVMTYLAFPPFPWYPVAPNTEGNPLFINKNLIECFALLALVCMPTGRWLGLDALIHRWIFGKEAETPVTDAAPQAAKPTA